MLQLIGSPNKSIVMESLSFTRKCDIILIGTNVPYPSYESGGRNYHIASDNTHEVLIQLDSVLPGILQLSEAEFVIIYTNTSNEELVRAIISSYCQESKIIFMHK